MHGKPNEREKSFAILYERILLKIPTTTNHAESYHSRINSVAADMRLTINNRLSLVACHIMKRLKQLDSSSISNLRNYLRKIHQKALKICEENPEKRQSYEKEFCDCKKASYYSTLYSIELPCIHMILNEKWKHIDVSDFLEKISVDDDLELQEPLKCFEVPDQRPKNFKDNNETDDDETDFNSVENIFQDMKKYEDPIENLIYHTYKQLENVCKIDEVEIGGIVVKVSQDLLSKQENLKIMEENFDEYLAMLHSQTLERILKAKGIFDKF